jgi:hypothetical protein
VTQPGERKGNMLGLHAQLQRCAEERKVHLEALSEHVLGDKDKALFEHLYACLSILDTKSQSLLGFNSIIIAVFTILLGRQLTTLGWVLAIAGVLLVTSCALLLLSVVPVRWSSTEDCNNPVLHKDRLLTVRNARTLRYRIAWFLAVVSMIDLAALFVRVAV